MFLTIVKVFPVPVCPYAKTVQLKPSRTSFTMGTMAWSYIDLCCALGPKTLKKGVLESDKTTCKFRKPLNKINHSDCRKLTLSKVKTLSTCLLATFCKTVTSLLCSLHETTLGTFNLCSSSLNGLI